MLSAGKTVSRYVKKKAIVEDVIVEDAIIAEDQEVLQDASEDATYTEEIVVA